MSAKLGDMVLYWLTDERAAPAVVTDVFEHEGASLVHLRVFTPDGDLTRLDVSQQQEPAEGSWTERPQ